LMTAADKQVHEKLFLDTIDKVNSVFDHNAFRQIDEHGKFANQVNRAIFDVVMLTFAHIPKADLVANKSAIIDALKTLCVQNDSFQDAIGKATRDKARINTRVRLWQEKLVALGLNCPALIYGN